MQVVLNSRYALQIKVPQLSRSGHLGTWAVGSFLSTCPLMSLPSILLGKEMVLIVRGTCFPQLSFVVISLLHMQWPD